MTGSLRIIADRNILQAEAAFDGLGTVKLADGRALKRDDLRGTDVLIVRSVTRVGEALLAGTPVRFVGTATIGTDHIDKEYLRLMGIGFASAKGCNANSVAEYVIAALLEIATARELPLEGKTLGIVGHGNIGSRLARHAPHLGLKTLVCDPPLQRASIPGTWSSLETVLAASDFVTFHVPLIRETPDRTDGMIDGPQLALMKQGAWLINTSRGQVVRGAALQAALNEKRIGGAILDVWEDEPGISGDLLKCVEMGTPHIAGYSFDGKLNGTRMMVEAVCRHFERTPSWTPQMPAPGKPTVTGTAGPKTKEEELQAAVRHAYDLRKDDAALRAGASLPGADFAKHFDELRRAYPVRHEFAHYRIGGGFSEAGRQTLGNLGFQIAAGKGGGTAK